MSFIKNFVESHYREWGVKSPKDVSLYLWNKLEDIRVSYRKGFTNSIAVGKSKNIFCARSPLYFRRVFIAHEIGHALLHSGNQNGMTAEEREKQERDADLFSMEALVPTYLLKETLKSDFGGRGQLEQATAEIYGIPLPFAARRLDFHLGSCSIRQLPTHGYIGHEITLRDPIDRRIEYLMWSTGEVVGAKML